MDKSTDVYTYKFISILYLCFTSFLPAQDVPNYTVLDTLTWLPKRFASNACPLYRLHFFHRRAPLRYTVPATETLHHYFQILATPLEDTN